MAKLPDHLTKGDELFSSKIRPVVEMWEKSKQDEQAARLNVLDTVTAVVVAEMCEKVPETGRTILRKEWRDYFKDRGCPPSSKEKYPFFSPFKHAIFPDQDWQNAPSTVTGDISRYSAVASLSVRVGKKPSELVAEHGSIRKAADAFISLDKDDELKEKAAADKAKAEKKAKDDADAERKRLEKAEELCKQNARNAELSAEKRKQDEDNAKAAQAAKDAKKQADELQRQVEKNQREAENLKRQQQIQEQRIKEQQEAAARAEAERAEEARKVEEARLKAETEKAEAEAAQARKAEEAERNKAALAELEKEAKARKVEADKASKKLMLASNKDRDTALMGMDSAWLKVVKLADGKWQIVDVQPVPADSDVDAAEDTTERRDRPEHRPQA